MANWQQFTHEAPELAAAVRARFEATKHHVLATLCMDGSPRVSGTEVAFTAADLTMGSMPGALKAMDLRRDGRCALHANPGDGSMSDGDAKVSGLAVEVLDGPELSAQLEEAPNSHLFRLELDSAVLTGIHPDGDRLLIRMWRPGKGVREFERQ